MQPDKTLTRKKGIFQKSWITWAFLILFPPLGLFILWKQKKYTTKKRWAITAGAAAYFAAPIAAGALMTAPLYYSHQEFTESFAEEVKALKLNYKLEGTKKEKETITSLVTDDVTVIENIDESGKVHELIMVGQGDGQDIVLTMGLLVSMTNPDLSKKEVGNVLKELRLFDESYNYHKNETSIEEGFIRYNLKYDQTAGVIFSVSRVN
ncbi:hypothetical protein ACFFJY_02425 [Fictibacillus aquaticus]|uniref:Uncharacterized protein n=1 Tax=Fictibacillus aquaticus TaxID=2021314 RepID=A0A235F8C2_9BACL|nr:hypothetical protein [Fictibacillus aquaticus]OYD57560.1 hypothetical protein CGZ90_12890 [Fictibacillus aquaticus]